MAEQLHSPNNLAFFLLCLAVAACARAAPELPATDFSTSKQNQSLAASLTRAERELTCKSISDQQHKIASEAKKLDDAIIANRKYNQAAIYTTSLILPPAGLIVAKHNKTEKDRLDVLQRRKDRLIFLYRLKRC